MAPPAGSLSPSTLRVSLLASHIRGSYQKGDLGCSDLRRTRLLDLSTFLLLRIPSRVLLCLWGPCHPHSQLLYFLKKIFFCIY